MKNTKMVEIYLYNSLLAPHILILDPLTAACKANKLIRICTYYTLLKAQHKSFLLHLKKGLNG